MMLFASAYIWDGLVEDPTLPTSLTSVAAIVILGGGGHMIDLRRPRIRGESGATASVKALARGVDVRVRSSDSTKEKS